MKIYLFKDYQKYFKQEKNSLYVSSPEELDLEKINKKQRVYLYDKTHIKEKKEKEILHTNNHINKSGTNPLLINKQKKIEFYDITQIYQQKTGGIVTTCLGKRYEKKKKEETNPSPFLAYFAIYLHIKGFSKITGKLINLKR